MELILYNTKAIIFIASKIYFGFVISYWKLCLEAKFSWALNIIMFLTFWKPKFGKGQEEI